MDILGNLAFGFSVAVSVKNLVYCFIGVFLGTLIGVLPGIGPVATVAMLLPLTFNLDAATAMIMLAGIYYGAQYGGSTTAILVNIPGESSSVVTTLDGYKMARQGRAGPALGIAAIGSFIAGSFATLIVALFSPFLADVALKFQPADYFSLMVFGLIGAVVLARGSLRKAIAMVVLGLLLGLIGTDVNSGVMRFTFGIPALAEGISFVALAMGMFGVAEVIYNLEQGSQTRQTYTSGLGSVLPSREDFRYCLWSIARGTGLGSVLGILPGGGALLSSFAAYTIEKKVAKAPRRFGDGDIRGVAAPESANNAGAQTSFIPMLTLGVPSNPTMALLIGALIIQGIQPGPNVMTQRPELFWGVVASMWIGNLFLLALNLPLIGLWVRLLAVPYKFLFPAILAFCCIGVFTINNNTFDVFQLVLFSALGYVLMKLGCEPAPLILGLVLGPMMEEYLRRALLISLGNPWVLVTRPISLAFLIASLGLLASIAVPLVRTKRQEMM
ncbi:MAG TPA: tripartite tricarboxylate transporter permease [Xanthobacteraceae bacterium]|nr:tripartite tricarboxylate transporter permease [Xanthobacteraceae bacterium]